MADLTPDTRLRHICEACGKEEVLTIEEGFKAGWDYPPALGAFKVLSPRTCGNCGVDKTLWWRMVVEKHKDLTPEELELLQRVEAEPESILVKEEV